MMDLLIICVTLILFWLTIEKNKTNALVIPNKMVTSPKDEELTTFICLSNQTRDGAAPFYVGSRTKKIEWLCSFFQTRNKVILF
jgi:hypothetical protein